jgi:DNA primase
MIGLRDRSVFYLYPSFLSTTSILLCEGEWDTLIARQHRLPAVGVSGVNIWDQKWNPAFAGTSVAIVFDCDDAGRSNARRRAEELSVAGARVKVVDLGLRDKEDLTDWFVKYRRTAEDLISLIRRTPFTGIQRPRVRRLVQPSEGKKKVPAGKTGTSPTTLRTSNHD